MELLFFAVGLLPYLIEIWFLRYAFLYRKPKPVKLSSEPYVSILVPIHKEPPSVVLKTLRGLRNQKYDFFEALVLVNNTPEEELKKPVREFCLKNIPLLKYYYFETSGFKGGVLEKSKELISDEAQIIAVVDSDYVVSDDFLKRGVSYFESENIGIVQFPQDYRDYPQNSFYRAMYLAYRYFFAVIMRMCHVLGAVAFMGTVGFIRRQTLQKAGSWSSTILTEDSEMGLRINLYRYRGIYVDESIGKGLMPFTFQSCRKQRFRWAYGNAQTILKHFIQLTFGKRLNFKQKIAFWIQNTVWHTPLLVVLLMSLLALFYIPVGYLGAGLLTGFLLSRTYGFLWVHKKIDSLPFKEALMGLAFYLSLFFPMSYAPIRVFIPIFVNFYRTPKALIQEKTLYFEEASLFALLVLNVFISLMAGLWINLYIFFISLTFYTSFIWVLWQERKGKIHSLSERRGKEQKTKEYDRITDKPFVSF